MADPNINAVLVSLLCCELEGCGRIAWALVSRGEVRQLKLGDKTAKIGD